MNGIIRLFTRTGTRRAWGPGTADAGFTLVELIVALAVVSAGTGVIITLFSQSLALGEASQNERVAASLVEAQLLDLELNPASYVWPAVSEAPAKLALRDEEPTPRGYVCQAPSATAMSQKGAERVQDYYEGFTWDAYVRLPQPAAGGPETGYVVVTMVVRWREQSRERSLSFTSSLPRTFVEEAA